MVGDLARMTSSFDFPGWKFSGSLTSGATSGAEERDWARDLDELSDDDDLCETVDDLCETVGSSEFGLPPTRANVQGAMAGGHWPEDVLIKVCSHIESAAHLCAARSVSRYWLKCASSDVLWRAQWEQTPRFKRPRSRCGAHAYSLPPTPHVHFWNFVLRVRADKCYRWFELQKGWDRLEELLQPALSGDCPLTYEARKPEPACAKRKLEDTCAESTDAESKREQARNIGGILSRRNWELLYSNLLLLQLEFAEQLGMYLELQQTRGTEPSVGGTSLGGPSVGGSSVGGSSFGVPPLGADDVSVSDEAQLHRLISAFRVFSRWLDEVNGCFAHRQGTPCCSHLVCVLTAHRGRELLSQHTPSLKHAGYAAFRAAVLLRPAVVDPLRRHMQRAEASILAQGGFSKESGARMQQLIDLHQLLQELDVRDDHLCEERGMQFTQERLRELLLAPLRRCWEQHSRSWFCGVRIDPSEHHLYASGQQRRRSGALISKPDKVPVVL